MAFLDLLNGFRINGDFPIDSRIVAADEAARLATPTGAAYGGLVVYQEDNNTLYVLTDGSAPGDDDSWEPFRDVENFSFGTVKANRAKDLTITYTDGTTQVIVDAVFNGEDGEDGDDFTGFRVVQPGQASTNTIIQPQINGVDSGDQIIIAHGVQGEIGDQGPSGQVSVGTTTTGDAGTDADVTNSGTPSVAVLNFTIPRGDKGDLGDAPDFTSGTHTANAVDPIDDDTVGVPTVSVTGTAEDPILNIGVPTGLRGERGQSGLGGFDIQSVQTYGSDVETPISEDNTADHPVTTRDYVEGAIDAKVGIEEFQGAEGEFSIVDTQVFTSTALTFVHSDDFEFDATDVAGAIDFRIHSYANLGPIIALETGTFTFNIVATSDTSTVVYELGTVPVTSNFGFDEVFEIPASTLTAGTSYSLQTIASTIVNTNLTIHTFWSLAFDGHVQVKPATKDYLDLHYATLDQGELADTAIQPGDLGTAATQDVEAFATGAEGDLATTALQRGEAVPIEDLPTQTAITDVDTLLPTSGAVIDYITTHTTPGTGSIPTQTTITDTDTMIPTSGAVVDYVEATAITKGDGLPGGDITDGTITGDQLDAATNTALAMAITAIQQENLGSPTVDTIPLTANRANPSDIDLSIFDSQAFTSIDTVAVIGTPPGTLAYLNGGGNLVDPGVAWADVQAILSGGATLSIFLGDNEGREFMIVEDDDNWAIFTSTANTSGNNESLALIPGESRGLTRQAPVTLYKSEAGVLSGMLGTTEFIDSAISQTNGIPVSSATVPTDSDNGTLATTEWVRDTAVQDLSDLVTTDELGNYAIRSEIGTLVIPSTTADFEFTGPYTFADNSQEIVFTGYTTGPDLSVDDTFRVITGFISSFSSLIGTFRLSEWTLSLRPTTGDDIVIGTAIQGVDTSHFVGTYVLNSTTVPTATANTTYSLVLSPEDTNVVLTDVRIHENYVGLTRVLPEIQAIIDASGGGEAEDQFADQAALQAFISDKETFRDDIVAAERPAADPTSANSVIQYATDGTPSYTSIPPGSTVDQIFNPTSANPQSGVAVQEATADFVDSGEISTIQNRLTTLEGEVIPHTTTNDTAYVEGASVPVTDSNIFLTSNGRFDVAVSGHSLNGEHALTFTTTDTSVVQGNLIRIRFTGITDPFDRLVDFAYHGRNAYQVVAKITDAQFALVNALTPNGTFVDSEGITNIYFNNNRITVNKENAVSTPVITLEDNIELVIESEVNGFELQGGTFPSKFSLFFGTPSAGAQVTVSAVGGDVLRTPEVYTTSGVNWYWWSDLVISGSNISVSTTNAGLWTNTLDPDTATIRFNLIG